MACPSQCSTDTFLSQSQPLPDLSLAVAELSCSTSSVLVRGKRRRMTPWHPFSVLLKFELGRVAATSPAAPIGACPVLRDKHGAIARYWIGKAIGDLSAVADMSWCPVMRGGSRAMEWWCRSVFSHLCKVRVSIRHVCPTAFHQTQQYQNAVAPGNATLQRRNRALLSTTLISFHIVASRRQSLFCFAHLSDSLRQLCVWHS